MDVLNRLAPASVLSDPIHVRWTGMSGRTYNFQFDAIGTPFRARAGVYVFCHFGHMRVVADYIGQTADFSLDLPPDVTFHPQWPLISAAGSTHISTLYVPTRAADRVKIEMDLRRALRARQEQTAA
jgi:hypothetical protein